MKIIVSRCHMHLSMATMITWIWGTKCEASKKRISAGFDLVLRSSNSKASRQVAPLVGYAQ